jgi:hypothetical protein
MVSLTMVVVVEAVAARQQQQQWWWWQWTTIGSKMGCQQERQRLHNGMQ